MSNQFKNPFKSTKLKAFFFFLVLATFFWALTKFSRQYTATVEASIFYVNIPGNTLITDDNLKEITFDLATNGFEFLFYKLKRPRIDIDVRRYYSEGDTQVIVLESELIKLISSRLNADLAVRNLSVKELAIKLDGIISKKIPVKVKTDFSYKDGFRPLDSLKVIPDSIVLYGPSIYLETIDFAETKTLTGKNLDKSVSKTAIISSFENRKVTFDPKEVLVSITVAEFSQKEINLPIELINVPQGIIVKLIPNTVKLTFNASVADFRKITDKDFKVICDYDQRNEDENFMIPRLVESSNRVINIEFDTKKIDYLIFK
mgnify:CR=1 FL=1